jgi:quinol monooxygenase YgiN
MTVYRIGEMTAAEGRVEDMRVFLLSILPIIRQSEGCQDAQMYQSQENLARFMIVEVWDSTASHQASVKNIPPEKLAEIRPLLGEAPNGSYFDRVDK